ncbi:hypothetical protein ACQPXH_33220 (plasmid) [Nocardia sp. CA-135953]|uniref:hypothetical protein n=1 Tax=Nocardia sp. CA-135953 TaxID=3239978 RepID=UPI003D99BB4B
MDDDIEFDDHGYLCEGPVGELSDSEEFNNGYDVGYASGWEDGYAHAGFEAEERAAGREPNE